VYTCTLKSRLSRNRQQAASNFIKAKLDVESTNGVRCSFEGSAFNCLCVKPVEPTCYDWECAESHFYVALHRGSRKSRSNERLDGKKIASHYVEDREQRDAFYGSTQAATDTYFEQKTEAMEERKNHAIAGDAGHQN
jgi:hypothetical protein